MKKLISVLLTLALLLAVSLSAAETTEASLLGEVKLGMSPEEIAALMGSETIYAADFSDTIRDEEYESSFAGMDTYAGFVFVNRSLAAVVYYAFQEDGPETLAAMKEKMTAAYGESAEVTPETIALLFSAIGSQEVPADLFSDGSAWTADDNSSCWVFMVNGEMCYVVYAAADLVNTIGMPEVKPAEEPTAETGSIEGTWKATDVKDDGGISAEELAQAKAQLENGDVVMIFIFSDGKVDASMTMYGSEQKVSGSYTVEGGKLTIIPTGEAGGNTLDYKLDGDTLEMNVAGATLIFTRQD